MFITEYTWLAILGGFLLDALIGDPQNPFHPIRLIGKVINGFTVFFEKRKFKKNSVQFLYGVITVISVVVIFQMGAWLIIKNSYRIHFLLGFFIEMAGSYFIIAGKALYLEGKVIYHRLAEHDIETARKRLSYIVGRDTEQLSQPQIVTAVVETISENLSDGVIAPLFYLFIGGLPLGIAYKAVNTLDSMIGYRNDKFEYYGKFSARLDDVCNFIPARLSAWFLIGAGLLSGEKAVEAINIYWRDKNAHTSPNSAHPEAACAGILKIRLGGPSVYGGKIVVKPYIGKDEKKAEKSDIKKAAELMYLAAVLFLTVSVIITLLCRLFLF